MIELIEHVFRVADWKWRVKGREPFLPDQDDIAIILNELKRQTPDMHEVELAGILVRNEHGKRTIYVRVGEEDVEGKD